MARQKRVLPVKRTRHPSRDDDSLLLRSAESLGRVIGKLQRQIEEAARRLSADPDGAAGSDAPVAKRATRATRSPRKTGASNTTKQGQTKRADTPGKANKPRKASPAATLRKDGSRKKPAPR